MAFCDPSSKLSFVMTQFYEVTDENAASCNFAGNATINSKAPTNTNQLNSAVSACLANTDVTFTPTAPASDGSSSSGSGSSSTSSSLGMSSFLANLKAGALGAAVLLLSTVATGFWTLA